MKTTKFLTVIMAIAVALSLNSCTKNGTTGPTGATGSQGPQGNANVTGQQFTVSSWSNNGSFYYTDFSVSALTPDILSGGAVEVYLSINGGTNWVALPFTQYASTDYIWTYVTGDFLVEPHWEYNGVGLGSDPNTVYGTTCEFNVVCIAPATINAHPNTNWKNAAEVAQLPEVQAYLNSKK
jgi:hypothetical protein